MFCTQCGAEVSEGYQFCPECGAKIPAQSKTAKKNTARPASGSKKPAAPKRKAAPKKPAASKPKTPNSEKNGSPGTGPLPGLKILAFFLLLPGILMYLAGMEGDFMLLGWGLLLVLAGIILWIAAPQRQAPPKQGAQPFASQKRRTALSLIILGFIFLLVQRFLPAPMPFQEESTAVPSYTYTIMGWISNILLLPGLFLLVLSRYEMTYRQEIGLRDLLKKNSRVWTAAVILTVILHFIFGPIVSALVFWFVIGQMARIMIVGKVHKTREKKQRHARSFSFSKKHAIGGSIALVIILIIAVTLSQGSSDIDMLDDWDYIEGVDLVKQEDVFKDGSELSDICLKFITEDIGALGKHVKPVNGIKDTRNNTVQIFFTTQKGFKKYQGVAFAKRYEKNIVSVSCVLGFSKNFSGEFQKYISGGSGAAQASAPSKPALTWSWHTSSDRTQKVQMPQGWRITDEGSGLLGGSGPQGAFGFGIPLRLHIWQHPYKSPRRAVLDVLPEFFSNVYNCPEPPIHIIHETQPQNIGGMEYQEFILDVDGVKGTARFFIMARTGNAGSNWLFYFSYLTCMKNDFKKNSPVLLKIFKSWNIHSSVFTRRMQQAARTFSQAGDMYIDAMAENSRRIDAVNDNFSEYIRGYRELRDTYLDIGADVDLYKIDDYAEEFNRRSGYERFKQVPLRNK